MTENPPYLKPYRTPSDCLAVLEERGLQIINRDHALRCLTRIGYYRMSAYWYHLRVPLPQGGTRERSDRFRDGACFDHALQFYLFDKKLRLLLNDPIERVEIAVRSTLIEVLGAISPIAHLEPENFASWFTNPSPEGKSGHDKFVAGQNDAFQRSAEPFAKHFRNHYSGPPPIWIAAGGWDWGKVSFMFHGLEESTRRAVAEAIVPGIKANVFASWLSALNEVRNACAHHSRLWNRAQTNAPSFKLDRAEFQHVRAPQGGVQDQYVKRLYGALIVLCFLNRQLHPDSRWHERLIALIDEEAPDGEISETAAGFPEGWRDQALWR